MADHDAKRHAAPPPDGTATGKRAGGPQADRLAGIAAALNAAPVQRAANRTGMPDQLKNGVEALSGMSLDHVRVHRNSDKPAQLNAHAYAQGADIHLAAGQERHLPHEAWHVVQQAQGRVKPTLQMKAGVPINDDKGLEAEADRMGALAAATDAAPSSNAVAPATAQRSAVVQRMIWKADDNLEWQATYNDPRAKKPRFKPRVVGALYNDETGVTKLPFGKFPLSKGDESDDEDFEESSSDESLDDSEEDSEEDSEDEQQTPLKSYPNAKPLSDKERRKIHDEARRKPITSSLLNQKRSGKVSSFSTDKTFNKKVRKKSSGSVSIDLEQVEVYEGKKKTKRERPIRIEGIVEPTTTKGRSGAPDPKSGLQIYSGQKGLLSHSIQTPRNDGLKDSERGHIMALELGGPDVPENIVPQWAKFQGVGEWRKMEKDVLARAKKLKKGRKLRYEVDVHYKSSGDITPTFKTFGFPTGFTTTIVTLDDEDDEIARETLFEQGQAQDATDDKLGERELYALDGEDLDTGLLLNSERALKTHASKKRARKKTTKKTSPKKRQKK